MAKTLTSMTTIDCRDHQFTSSNTATTLLHHCTTLLLLQLSYFPTQPSSSSNLLNVFWTRRVSGQFGGRFASVTNQCGWAGSIERGRAGIADCWAPVFTMNWFNIMLLLLLFCVCLSAFSFFHSCSSSF